MKGEMAESLLLSAMRAASADSLAFILRARLNLFHGSTKAEQREARGLG